MNCAADFSWCRICNPLIITKKDKNLFSVLRIKTQDKMQKHSSPMFQCACCSAGGTVCSSNVSAAVQQCVKCGSALGPYVCRFCVARYERLCVKCRPHICLSKCSGGCIKRPIKKKPACGCNAGPVRLRVNKEGANKGKFFWTCHQCKFFEWD